MKKQIFVRTAFSLLLLSGHILPLRAENTTEQDVKKIRTEVRLRGAVTAGGVAGKVATKVVGSLGTIENSIRADSATDNALYDHSTLEIGTQRIEQFDNANKATDLKYNEKALVKDVVSEAIFNALERRNIHNPNLIIGKEPAILGSKRSETYGRDSVNPIVSEEPAILGSKRSETYGRDSVNPIVGEEPAILRARIEKPSKLTNTENREEEINAKKRRDALLRIMGW